MVNSDVSCGTVTFSAEVLKMNTKTLKSSHIGMTEKKPL